MFPFGRRDDPPSRLALIDLGSNTALLSVLFGAPQEARRLRVAEELQIMTGLGRDKGPNGELDEAAKKRVLRAMGHFASRLHALGIPPSAVLGATTAAMREAPDGREFIALIRERTGIELQVISGEEEAEYVALAQEHSLPEALPILMIDIGGGSTEVALRRRGSTDWKTSTPIGSVKISEAHGTELDALSAAAREATAHLPPARGPHTVVGVAGTVTTGFSVARSLRVWDPSQVQGKSMTRDEVLQTARRLALMSPGERRSVPGLPTGRADYIVGGLIILATVMEYYNAMDLRISDRGVRFGLLWERYPLAVVEG